MMAPDDCTWLVDSSFESSRSPAQEIEAAWAKEIERRIAVVDRGEMAIYDAADVFAEARRISR